MLPKNVTIKSSDGSFIFDSEELSEAIVDYLSNTYGYCINGCTYSFEIKVTDIDWDEEE